MSENLPIFYDAGKKRWPRLRMGLFIAGSVFGILGIVLLLSILFSPKLVQMQFPNEPHKRHSVLALPLLTSSVQQRLRSQVNRDIVRQQQAYRAAESTRKAGQTAESPKVIGFFVNWDDSSFTSLKQNLPKLDVLMPEWMHLADTSGNIELDNKSYQAYVTNYIRQQNPSFPILPLVNNFNGQTWESAKIGKMLESPDAQNRSITQLLDYIQTNHYAGISLDLENIPDSDQPLYATYVENLSARFHAAHLAVSVNLPPDSETILYARLSAAVDTVVLMMYDEHATSDAAGPIASIDWYTTFLQARTKDIPTEKMIVALGNYAYDWQDGKSGDEKTFEEAMMAAKDSGADITLDPLSLNPFYAYQDDTDHTHTVWMQDASTAFNEYGYLSTVRPHGVALWRLGSEDTAVWNFIGTPLGVPYSQATIQQKLGTVEYGYDLDYESTGEILSLTSLPATGSRNVSYDPTRGLIRNETYTAFPTPYVITRHGSKDHQIALTFDDGPDPTYTPQVLRILQEKQVPGTFFIIGQNGERYPNLVKQEFDLGNEIGNHSYTHPNVSLITSTQLRLELTATERLFEGILGRQSVLFRPPYADDAEPETPDQMKPLVELNALGYILVGMQIDPSDWLSPPAEKIVSSVIAQAEEKKGNIVLLHDAGGNRDQTIQALPSIIDGLRARGYTFVTVSALMGKTRDQVMPPITGIELLKSHINFLSFEILHLLGVLLGFFFITGILLGILRLLVMGPLALSAYLATASRGKEKIPACTLPVAIVIAAFNEAKVIEQTVRSLLHTTYTGPLSIIVVDDGSTDDTLDIVQRQFDGDPRITSYRIANRGKSGALNYGIEKTNAPIIITLDADTVFLPNTVEQIVRPFSDSQVAAVAGNARVGNRTNLLTRFQALEYITSQNLDRRAFSALNCITVVPGAVGAWRRDLLLAEGGFTYDTLAEDADMTLRLLRQGYRIAYEDQAIAYTEAPSTVRDLISQRFRWMYGTFQAAWKHRDVLLRSRYGALGFVALPSVIIFQILFPLISPVMDATLVLSAIIALLNFMQHPETFHAGPLLIVATYYALFLLIDFITAGLAFLFEKNEDPKLLWLLLLQRFYYRQIMYYVAIKSFLAVLKGFAVGWNKLERSGTVTIVSKP